MIILILIIFLLIIYIYRLNKEIRNINNQIDFLNKNDTRLKISNEFRNKEIIELSEKLNKYFDNMENLRLEIKRKDMNSRDIIVGLSHDIRTPLTSLDGYLQLLSKSDNKEDNKKYLSIISNRVESLNVILDELFTYSKLEHESYSFDLEKINLREEITQSILSFYEDFTEKNIEPMINIIEKDIYILGQKDAVNRIFINILKNALDHGRRFIDISLREVGDEYLVSVRNEIDGSEDIDQEQIFNQFYKGSSSRKSSSTGLGLYIAKGLAEKIGARLEASLDDHIFEIYVYFKKLD